MSSRCKEGEFDTRDIGAALLRKLLASYFAFVSVSMSILMAPEAFEHRRHNVDTFSQSTD